MKYNKNKKTTGRNRTVSHSREPHASGLPLSHLPLSHLLLFYLLQSHLPQSHYRVAFYHYLRFTLRFSIIYGIIRRSDTSYRFSSLRLLYSRPCSQNQSQPARCILRSFPYPLPLSLWRLRPGFLHERRRSRTGFSDHSEPHSYSV